MSQPSESTRGAALVTGASRGIGKQVSLRLAGLGYPVGIHFRNATGEAAAVVRAITEAGGRAHAFRADLSVQGEAARIVEAAQAVIGPLEILVNNAGITRDRLMIQMSEEDWAATWSTDLMSAREAGRTALLGMQARGHGRIVNVSSVVGTTGNAGQANYATAKSAVEGLTRGLAVQAAPHGVTVNCVIPGYIVTDATAHLTEEQRQAWFRRIPMGRPAAPEEVADLIVFLATGPAGYVTGQCIAIDGGLLAVAGGGLYS